MTNGPRRGPFTVYEDLNSHKDGVYQHVLMSGNWAPLLFAMLGWAWRITTPYWLIANSWKYLIWRTIYFKIFVVRIIAALKFISLVLPKL
ncbi:Cathepsin B [Lucilia cuprina]|nr:Cathepsin B [Lucilia cuprina]